MRSMLRERRLIWPTMLTIAGLAILVSLGNWQLRRLAWKEGLIARMEGNTKRDPIGMGAAMSSWAAQGEAIEYSRVAVRGTFIDGVVRYYYAADPRLGPGTEVYAPLRYDQDNVVWVDRGFLPDRFRPFVDPAAGREVSVVGALRAPGRKGLFSPENDPKANIWYWRDLDGMQRSAFEAGKPSAAPFFIEAIRIEGAETGEWPRPGAAPVRFENRHLEYALTWYGLALTLAAVYLAYALSRSRRSTGRT